MPTNVLNEVVAILFSLFLYTGPAIALLASIWIHFFVGLPIGIIWLVLMLLLLLPWGAK